MLTVRFGLRKDEIYTFRYYSEQHLASVTYPNGTSSQTERGDVINPERFLEYIASTLGNLLVNTLSTFYYLSRKNLALQYNEFKIDNDILVTTTISDNEQTDYRRQVTELDDLYFGKTGLRFNLTEFNVLTVGRYRPDIELKLAEFGRMLQLS